MSLKREHPGNTHSMVYLDLEKGDLLYLLRDDFSRLAGNDPRQARESPGSAIEPAGS